MTNRLELNWKLDGFVDEQRYYCSETPMDVTNLPTPKAVLAGDIRAYIDTDIVVGQTYYVRVGSIKNGIEKISDEQMCEATSYKIYTIFINAIDERGDDAVSWSNNGGVTFNQNGATFDTLSKYLSCSTTLDLNSDFKISFDVLFNSFTRPNGVPTNTGAFEIVSNASSPQNDSSRFFAVSAISDGNPWGGVDRSLYFGVSNLWATETTTALNLNQFYNVEVERIGSNITLKLDGVLLATKTNAPSMTNTGVLRVGSTQRNTGGYGNYVVKNMKVN